ncbi:unnamed protein product [Urochloa decumbens]|uniref:F-box domain-containing protein n=1 Tax=Urochloa decumbens TaxID=240449 RepID=A0ABC9FPN0_9POAL
MASLGPQTMASNDAGLVLPHDALHKILLPVPARPLCRFRAVCKSWRSLLSDDPPLAAAHAARHPLFAIAVAGGSHGEGKRCAHAPPPPEALGFRGWEGSSPDCFRGVRGRRLDRRRRRAAGGGAGGEGAAGRGGGGRRLGRRRRRGSKIASGGRRAAAEPAEAAGAGGGGGGGGGGPHVGRCALIGGAADDGVSTSASHGEAAEVNILDTSGHVVKRVSAGASALLRQMLPHLGLILTRHLVAVEGAYRALCVINPATGTVSLLPDDGGHFYSSFVFGRVASSTKGNDGGEYKVLSLSHHVTQVCNVLAVDGNGAYHGTWRIVPTNPPVRIDKFHRETVVAKGVVYHLVDSANNDGWTMAVFDLAAEEWRPALVQGPVAEPSIGGNVWRNSLAEVNGRLAAVSSTVSTMDIWLLMGSGEQAMWRKRCRILTSSIQRPHGLFPDVEPLWALDDGRVALWVTSCRARVASGLWMYDPRTETCTEVAAVENFLKVGVGVYTGNLLQLPQRAHDK